jgi:MFS family permease
MHPENSITYQIRQGLKNSIYDGAFAQIMIVLTSGIFLTGFALTLGANEFHIGVLAAIPLMAQLTQLGTSFLIEQRGARKKTLLVLATLSRYSWLMLFAVLLLHDPKTHPLGIWILVGVCIISYVSGSAGAVAWLSWMADLVPEKIRGRYFAQRNRILALVGVVVTLVAGYYLDLWKIPGKDLEVYGFLSLFLLAVVCGEISLRFLRRIPALETEKPPVPRMDFWRLVRLPFRDSNFVKLALFSMAWSFSVSLAAPFFAVYMLMDLKMSYALLALVHIVNELASILALPLWGKLSDRFGSKPVLSLTTLAAAFLPILWLFTVSRHFVLIIVILQLYGGIFWSGLNLNSNNILLKLSPKEHNSAYLAAFAAVTGLATAVAPLLGGVLAVQLRDTRLSLGPVTIYDLHFVFLISGVMRLVSRIFLEKIVEPKEKPVGEMIRTLRRFRTLSVTKGFEPLLNYVYLATTRIADFIERKENADNGGNQNGFLDGQK